MGFPVGEIQTALIAAYRGDTTLQGLLGNPANPPGNVFDADGIPTNLPVKYIVVQPVNSQKGAAFAMGTDAVDVFMQVSIFTQANGYATARAIAKRIYQLTDQVKFSLANGFINIMTLFEHGREMDQPDGITQGLIQEFKLWNQG